MPDGTRTETADVDAGIETLRRLVEMDEATATGDAAEVFGSIRATLRTPFVPAPFRILATGPFLVPAWRATEAIVGSIGFEERADRFREAVADLVGRPEGPLEIDLPEEDERKLRSFLDSVHYVAPKVVLVLELFDRVALDDLDGSVQLPQKALTREPPVEAWAPPLLPVADAEGQFRAVFKDIQRRHDHPFVADLYRGLTAWPTFLQNAWGIVGPSVEEGKYTDLRQRIHTLATDLVAELDLSGPPRDEGTLRGSDRDEARDLLAALRFRSEPDLLVDVMRIKALLDGPEAAHVSRFSEGSA